ncbi:MAG: hypothetical protein LPJ91_04040 [Pseudazoarcus pumilus]|nr:hypothetical protein [Pseudazoarcus pumilus]
MIEALIRLLTRSIDNFERRWGMRDDRKERRLTCPCCNGRGILPDSGDICGACGGSGRCDPED